MFIVFWLNYQVGLQLTDYFAPHPFLKIYVSNVPQKHLNLSIPHPPKLFPVLIGPNMHPPKKKNPI